MVNQQRLRLSFLPLLLIIFLASPGCAGQLPAVRLARETSTSLAPGSLPQALSKGPGDGAAASDRVYETIEAAVHDAFAAAEAEAGPADRDRMRLGTIRRVAGGFRWTVPVRSRATVGAMAPLQVRFRLGPDDVAVYSVHPRSGEASLDQRNERIGRGEQKLVDEQDPLHRPLFVRTPSRRTLRYPVDPAAEATVEVVRRD